MNNMYVKRPVIIEARQLLEEDSAFEIQEWINTNRDRSKIFYVMAYESSGRWFLEIETLEGLMTASPGDFIIKGIHGEFYPCKPDIFEQSYEPFGFPVPD